MAGSAALVGRICSSLKNVVSSEECCEFSRNVVGGKNEAQEEGNKERVKRFAEHLNDNSVKRRKKQRTPGCQRYLDDAELEFIRRRRRKAVVRKGFMVSFDFLVSNLLLHDIETELAQQPLDF